jgi:hypothetical protein
MPSLNGPLRANGSPSKCRAFLSCAQQQHFTPFPSSFLCPTPASAGVGQSHIYGKFASSSTTGVDVAWSICSGVRAGLHELRVLWSEVGWLRVLLWWGTADEQAAAAVQLPVLAWFRADPQEYV